MSGWLNPQVLIVPRLELELADVYVVRRDAMGNRFAYDADRGWQPVAPGSEAHRLARLTSRSGDVPLLELDAALEPVRRAMRADAL